jgi:hypothetical protein
MTEAEEKAFYREINRCVKNGVRPPVLDKPIICRECGAVWSMEPAAFISDSCFWCFNRMAGKPIPRPSVTPEMHRALVELGLIKLGNDPKKSKGFIGHTFLKF